MVNDRPVAPLELTVWCDFQCQYSERAIRWLDGLGPRVVRPTYRAFGQEQVNRDASATTWRLWEQPLDYEHHGGKPWKRSLAAFLATAILDAAGEPEVATRFRHAVLVELAGVAGADAGALAEALAGSTPDGLRRQADARARIAADWVAARADFAIFGVPTLRWGLIAPIYLRLRHVPEPDEARSLFDALVDLRERFPLVLELKEPGRVDAG